MKQIETSLIITVLNEAKTIELLLESILLQTILPQEVVIVDGGSSDETMQLLTSFAHKHPQLSLIVDQKKGNRSVGRNWAAQLTKNKVLAVTDAGCQLHPNWLAELIAEYERSGSPVVAGYYSSKARTNFQKAVVPYVLVMPDRVNPETFLPATRSMLIEKDIFIQFGGFDETLADNEDYAFAKKLQTHKIKIAFTSKAIVYWKPTETIGSFYSMIFRFARGDVFAGIIRPKVITVFLRYLFFFFVIVINKEIALLLAALYINWSIQKNKKYVATGWYYLPVLQIVSDIAVIFGSISGFLRRIIRK